jgi:hypothetical protein
VSADIIPFPAPEQSVQGWACACGNFHWILYADGQVYCPACNHISSVLKVEHVEATPETTNPSQGGA